MLVMEINKDINITGFWNKSGMIGMESGRSMVEMLGTLTIIGVLSISGIAGYSYGMDKYRANETMRDISLRTVDLIAQANRAADLSFAEWENEDSIYDFSNPTYVEGENLIAFDIGATKKLPQSVCQMVFDNLSTAAVQIDINESVATSKDSCDEDNTMTFYFASGGNATTDTDTDDGATDEQCGETVCGICERCDSIGALSDPDYGKQICYPLVNYSNCTTDNHENGWCISGKCQPNTITCNCGPNQYCADKNTSCVPSPSGTCKDLDFKTVNISGTTYYISKNKMSWWDAQSACDALGNKQLLSIYELVNNFDDNIGYGCQDLTNTALGNALYEKGWSSSGSPYILSNTVYSSCSVLYVDLKSGFVSGNTFYDNDFFYAVCR